MNINDFPPNKQLYLRVRGGFVSQGTTLSAFCKSRKANPTNAKSALIGVWDGPAGKAFRLDLIEASGIVPLPGVAVA